MITRCEVTICDHTSVATWMIIPVNMHLRKRAQIVRKFGRYRAMLEISKQVGVRMYCTYKPNHLHASSLRG